MCIRDSHGALTRYVAHLLAVVALRLLVTFRAVTSQVVTLSAPGEGTTNAVDKAANK